MSKLCCYCQVEQHPPQSNLSARTYGAQAYRRRYTRSTDPNSIFPLLDREKDPSVGQTVQTRVLCTGHHEQILAEHCPLAN